MKACPVFLAKFLHLGSTRCLFFMMAYFSSRFYCLAIKIQGIHALFLPFRPFLTTHFVLHGGWPKQNTTFVFRIGTPFMQHYVD